MFEAERNQRSGDHRSTCVRPSVRRQVALCAHVGQKNELRGFCSEIRAGRKGTAVSHTWYLRKEREILTCNFLPNLQEGPTTEDGVRDSVSQSL